MIRPSIRFAAACLVGAICAPAQQPDPNPTFIPLGHGSYRLDWTGADGWTVIPQFSTNLVDWHYFPEIHQGVIHDTIGVTPTYEEDGQVFPYPDFFMRLVMSDYPTLDPKNADFDGDGLSNWEELTIYGTDPFKANTAGGELLDGQTDLDDDGLPDQWEQWILDFIGDPSLTIDDIDPYDDFDGDGLSNLEEFRLGLNPCQPDSNGDGYGDRLSVDRALHLKLDESTGPVALDTGGMGRHGTLVSSAAWEPASGIDHGALRLNGGADALALPPATLDGATDLTISLWFKTSAAPAAQTLLSTAGGSQSPLLAISIEDGATIRFDPGAASPVTWNTGRNLADELWHHLVIVRDASGGEAALFLDGAPCGAPHSITPAVLTVDSLVLGQRHASQGGFDPAHAFTGLLDEVRVYSVRLATDHLLNLFLPNDLDGDGLPDDWEMKLFGNLATLAAADDDPDGDGLSNRQEFEAGTHPGDYFNGLTPVVELVAGADQEILNGQRTAESLVFRVTSDGSTPMVGAPVTIEQLNPPEPLGVLLTLDGARLGPAVTLTTDANGEVAVHFKAD